MANSARHNPKDVHPELRMAISRYWDDQTDKNVSLIYQVLFQGSFLLASDFVGHETAPGAQKAQKQEVGIKTITNTQGEVAMMAFTDTNALMDHCGPDARYLTIDTNSMLNMVMTQDLSGVVINVAGPNFYFSREHINDILQTAQRRTSFSASSIDIYTLENPTLVEAITKLNTSNNSSDESLFLDSLWQSTLLLPMDQEDDGRTSYVISLKSPNGLNAFPAFTDLAAAKLFAAPQAKLIPFDFLTVLEMVVNYPSQIFVINPNPNAGEVTQIEIDIRKMKYLHSVYQQTGQRAGATLTAQ